MSDIDFDEALAPLEPKNTARMVLRGVKVNGEKDVVLLGVHAGALNSRHESLTDKLTTKHQAVLAADDEAARKATIQAMFTEVFSKTVITGWENVCERGGQAAKFTPSDCESFLRALGKRRPDLADANHRGGCAVELFFKNPIRFADGYSESDAEAVGEG